MAVLHLLKQAVYIFRERLHFSHFRTKAILLIVISVFIPLIISLVVFNAYTSDTLYQQQQGTLKNSFSQLYDIFNSRLETVRQDMKLLQIDTNIRQLLQEPLTNAVIMSVSQRKAEMNTALDYIEDKNIWGMHLRVFLPEDRYILVDDTRFFASSSVEEESWYRLMIDAPYKNQWIYGAEQDREIAFSYLVRVFEPTNYRGTTAVVRLDFSFDEVSQTMLQSLPLIDGSAAYLVTDEGDLIVPVMVGDAAAAPVIKLLENVSYSVPTISTMDQGIHRYLVFTQSFKYHPWKLIMVQPQATGLQLLLDNSRWTALLSIVILCGILVFVLSFLYTRHIVRQITQVSIGMSNLKDGQLQRLPEPKTMDEIGLLVESYNYLTDELKMLNAGRDLANANQKQAEFVALQAQINPHFLYNTLEMINYFAMVGDAKQVERIVMLLSHFYKRCLNHGAEYATLTQELDLTKTYFKIQEIRYRNRIRMEQHVPEELLACQIPHIVLQPIVENAIHHGIMSTEKQEGTITISAAKKDGMLEISVHDDGAGIPEDKMIMLSKGMEFAYGMAKEGSHYGLRNIDKRLKNLYGEAYGLHFESELNIGSTVTLVLPLIQED